MILEKVNGPVLIAMRDRIAGRVVIRSRIRRRIGRRGFGENEGSLGGEELDIAGDFHPRLREIVTLVCGVSIRHAQLHTGGKPFTHRLVL